MNSLPPNKAKTGVGSEGFGVGAGKMSAPGTNENAGGGALSIPHDQRNTGITSAGSHTTDRRIAHNEVHHGDMPPSITSRGSVGTPPSRG